MLKSYEKLLKSSEFKSFLSKNKDSYLSSCVLITNTEEKEVWNFDFYIPKINKITTFIVDDEISSNEEQKIFEQTDRKLKKIDLNGIKFGLDQVNKLIDKKFDKIKILKRIIILQNLEELTWNVSLLRLDFNLTNIKINAVDGKIMSESSTSMLQFKAG